MTKLRFKIPIIGPAISSLLILVMTLGIAAPAFADGGGGDLIGGISSGTLTVLNTVSPTLTQSLTLDGKDDTIAFKIPLTVTNGLGTGASWVMYANAQQFSTETAVDASSLHVLNQPVKVSVKDSGSPLEGITLPNSTATLGCDTLSSCSLPTSLASDGATVGVESASWDSGQGKIVYGTASGTQLFAASTNHGMGTMYLEADFSISVPADEVVIYGGTTAYTATFAITFADTPV